MRWRRRAPFVGALLAENGKDFRRSSMFVGQQWLWFNRGDHGECIRRRQLVEHLSAAAALKAGAAIARLRDRGHPGHPASAQGAEEQGQQARVPQHASRIVRGTEVPKAVLGCGVPVPLCLRTRFRHPALLPHDDTLRFSQAYIGVLGAIASAGWIVGALVHRWLLPRMSSKIAALFQHPAGYGVRGLLSAAHRRSHRSARQLWQRLAAMIATIASLTLAAQHCPSRAEASPSPA